PTAAIAKIVLLSGIFQTSHVQPVGPLLMQSGRGPFPATRSPYRSTLDCQSRLDSRESRITVGHRPREGFVPLPDRPRRARSMVEPILVPGGAGFIGAYVVRRLLSEGCRVVVYDMQVRDNTLSLLPDIPTVGSDLLIEPGAITNGQLLLDVCRRHEVA